MQIGWTGLGQGFQVNVMSVWVKIQFGVNGLELTSLKALVLLNKSAHLLLYVSKLSSLPADIQVFTTKK